MRARTVVLIVALLLPVGLDAQRVPKGRRHHPAEPVPLSPQPTPIAMMLAVKRSRITVETYPFVSRVQSPGFNGLISGWTTLGAGTRGDYRFNRFVSGTLDLTSTVAGGPAQAATAELGARFHPERSESRFYPYADVRFGYISAMNKDPRDGIADLGGGFASASPTARYSNGLGAVAGIGTEYALWRSWSLTTGFSVLQNRMTTRGIQGEQDAHRSFAMTWYRYTIGVSYNPLRIIPVQGGDTR